MKISIFGAAGTVGSCTTFAIAERGLADEIVMLDTRYDLLMNHMMDIGVSAKIRHDTVVRTGTDEQDISGSDIVIIAVGITLWPGHPETEMLTTNIPVIRNIVKNIVKYCPDAIVITASNPIDTWNYVVYLTSSLDRKQLLGYNMNDSVRFRIATASALGIKPSRVEAIAAGIHPEAQVLLSNSLKVDGKVFTLDGVLKRRVFDEATNYLKTFTSFQTGRTAGWTTGSGIADTVTAVVNDSRRIMACSVVVEGEYGYRNISLGFPVVIGRKGALHVVEIDLTPEDKAELDAVAQKMEAKCAQVRKIVGVNAR